jgi:hypothetical protein
MNMNPLLFFFLPVGVASSELVIIFPGDFGTGEELVPEGKKKDLKVIIHFKPRHIPDLVSSCAIRHA